MLYGLQNNMESLFHNTLCVTHQLMQAIAHALLTPLSICHLITGRKDINMQKILLTIQLTTRCWSSLTKVHFIISPFLSNVYLERQVLEITKRTQLLGQKKAILKLPFSGVQQVPGKSALGGPIATLIAMFMMKLFFITSTRS